ncbi:MAG: fumarylacetoacetate hydrolase family protein [Bacteroidetes bacterium]|jgi:2-keto-4-pentenoate hydratase/2-oxohepta-3-ene-1,7-dioic acid hydratase in catechol pathway|nr:fumarylacetoacetate hydrolase family protein [Bacteroidota bacterium]
MKIFCIGRNYAEHAKELKNELPENPVVFMKPTTALLKDGQAFFYPDFTNDLHYEGEIVLRIGKNGKKIQEKFAHKYIDAFTIGFDLTARDIQNDLKSKGLPWELAKGFDGSAIIGNFIKINENINLSELKFSILKNDVTVQMGNAADMIFSFERVISFVSQYFTLQQGDLIFTGTPKGVGALAIGDVLNGFYDREKLVSVEIK